MYFKNYFTERKNVTLDIFDKSRKKIRDIKALMLANYVFIKGQFDF